jgi:hypothetical protein
VTGIQINHNKFEVVFDIIVSLGGLIGHVQPIRERSLVFNIPLKSVGAQKMPENLVEVIVHNEVTRSGGLLWG